MCHPSGHSQNVPDSPADAGAHRAREMGVQGRELPLWPWEKRKKGNRDAPRPQPTVVWGFDTHQLSPRQARHSALC